MKAFSRSDQLFGDPGNHNASKSALSGARTSSRPTKLFHARDDWSNSNFDFRRSIPRASAFVIIAIVIFTLPSWQQNTAQGALRCVSVCVSSVTD